MDFFNCALQKYESMQLRMVHKSYWFKLGWLMKRVEKITFLPNLTWEVCKIYFIYELATYELRHWKFALKCMALGQGFSTCDPKICDPTTHNPQILYAEHIFTAIKHHNTDVISISCKITVSSFNDVRSLILFLIDYPNIRYECFRLTVSNFILFLLLLTASFRKENVLFLLKTESCNNFVYKASNFHCYQLQSGYVEAYF